MHKHTLALLLAGILVSGTLLAGIARGEAPRPWFPRLAPVPKTPALYGYHPPKAGPRPYYGEALGATYYNWGYFGAHYHSQLMTHTGYENEYQQCGRMRGY